MIDAALAEDATASEAASAADCTMRKSCEGVPIVFSEGVLLRRVAHGRSTQLQHTCEHTGLSRESRSLRERLWRPVISGGTRLGPFFPPRP
jgi:hypothetical protein